MVPVECIARGYLTGSGLKEYQRTGAVSGVALPPGLVEGSRLPEPIFTPTTKAPLGEHDEFITFADVVAEVGAETADELRGLTLEVYRRGAELAAEPGHHHRRHQDRVGPGAGRHPGPRRRGADPGLVALLAGRRVDSPAGPQCSFDKQFVRDWAAGTGWDKTPPGPEIPAEVVEATRARYVDVYEAHRQPLDATGGAAAARRWPLQEFSV